MIKMKLVVPKKGGGLINDRQRLRAQPIDASSSMAQLDTV